MKVYAVIPALNERDAIAWLIDGLSPAVCDGVVVADGGSQDGTCEAARAAGATVVVERRRGYGRAVSTGIAAAREAGADVVAVVDGNGTISPECVADIVAPLRAGSADLAVGIRHRGSPLTGRTRHDDRASQETPEEAGVTPTLRTHPLS